MITENLSTLEIHKLTQEQYDRELAAGNLDENALYLTPDEETDIILPKDGLIKIGDTTLTEDILKKLIDLLNTPNAEEVAF